ncbi:MAG: NAD(P)-dependent oxidoreductase [Candidatus Rokubacteria bacterium]|nr:NAD(P)-dependent oxidoreductase [Candidatus Rokubacteria bacterium]MBI3826474.1 NAD(P)-dependent oxidoreductase [Candidatus Rokubacteria bacterium]
MNLPGEVALVTGAAGLVGSRVVRRLSAEGVKVRAMARRPIDLGDAVTICLGDVRDAAAVAEAVRGASLIVHCAAVLRSATRDEAMAVNLAGTRLVLEAALAGGCRRVIHISTISVHDLEGRDVVDESTPLVGHSDAYAEGKAAAERAVWAAAERGLEVTVLRPPAILGAHPTCYWTVRWPQQMAAGTFSLHGDGRYSLPYVHVDNLAQAVVLAARSERAVGQAYNVIDGQTTWRELTDRYLGWLGLQGVPSSSPEAVPPGYRWRGRWSGEKIRQHLGYAPCVTFDEAMVEAKRYLVETGTLAGSNAPPA